MGIQLGSNFTQTSALPLDDRSVVSNITARDAIATGRRFNGMKVYVVATQTNWQLQGGVTNAHWIDLATGASSTEDVDLSMVPEIDVHGNLAITLRARINSIVLQDELSNLWRVTASDSGEMIIEDATGTSVTEILLVRDDLTQAALKILSEQIVSDTTLGVGELIANCYLMSPNGMAWKVHVTTNGHVWLESGGGNTFSLKDQLNQTFFKISQDVPGTMHETKPFPDTLPTPSPEGTNVPFAIQIVDGQPVMKMWNGTEWKALAFQTAPPPTDPFPLGTVMSSFLTEEEFLVEMNDSTGARWTLIDGSGIPDSNLAIIRGWDSLPQGKGMFLRGLDETGTIDADLSTSRVKHGPDYLGSFQTDMYINHNHYSGWGTSRTTGIFGNVGVDTHLVEQGSGANASSTPYTSSSGGTETRPKNIAVNFFVKYNRG